MRTKVLAAISVALPFSSLSAQSVPEQPTIVVDGYGEVRTPPDIANISYTLRGEGKTSDEAVKAMVASGARIQQAIRTIDASAEAKTSKVEVVPAKGSNCKDANGDYDSADERLSVGACAIVGYIATQPATLRTENVKDAGTMVGVISRSGANGARIQDFDVSDHRPAYRQAMAAALADAKAKANAIAIGSNLNLGPVLRVTSMSRGEGNEIVVTGSLLPRRQMSTPVVVVPLAPEPITTSATVSVTYEIAR